MYIDIYNMTSVYLNHLKYVKISVRSEAEPISLAYFVKKQTRNPQTKEPFSAQALTSRVMPFLRWSPWDVAISCDQLQRCALGRCVCFLCFLFPMF